MNIQKMQEAANLLCGYHNFKNFCKMAGGANEAITISEALPDEDEIVEYLVELDEFNV